MLAPGTASSWATSLVTCSKTRLGRAPSATSVATLRSAACSSASARWAPSAFVRSAVTAASTSDVSAAMAMKSWVASRLSVIESRTNGPSFSAVIQTVIEHTTRIAVAAPRGPNRIAAHSRTGNTMYGTSRCGGRMASATRSAMTTAPSMIWRRPRPFVPMLAQVRITGARTSAPAASPSVQVRNTRPSSSGGITSPARSASGPNAALISAPTSAAATNASTSATRSSDARPSVSRRSSRTAAMIATVFPTVWARTVPSGVEKSASSRSPITIPGHSRRP